MIAGVVLVLGIVLVLVPTSVSGGVGCGSALAPDTTSASAAEFGEGLEDVYAGGDGSDTGGYVAACEDRVSTQRFIAFPIIGIGALALLFLALSRTEDAVPGSGR